MSQTNGISSTPSSSSAPAAGQVVVEATRPRQTQARAAPFRSFLAGGVNVLMGGAQVATSVLGGPVLAAAVQDARVQATGAIVGADGPRRGAPASETAAAATGGAAVGAAVTGTTGADGTDLATMQAMQRESQAFNMQLLALQEDVQQENRRFTTLSNVLRAKHDTAKAAVSNIRS
jgi:hypothetical protein